MDAQKKETIRNGLRALTSEIYEAQTKLGQWPPRSKHEDLSGAFAEIHAKVSRAYDSYQEGVDASDVIWMNDQSGSEEVPGEGVPQGLAADFSEILFDVLALGRRLGMDPGIVADIAEAQTKYADEESEDDDSEESEDDEEETSTEGS